MILVTGSNGLVGASLVIQLLREKLACAAFDRGPSVGFVDGYHSVDMTDLPALQKTLEQVAPSAIIHCAAMTAVDKCETDRELAWKSNVEATAAIARYCSAYGCRLIYLSTDFVFSGNHAPYNEESAIRPLGVYAQSKAGGELAVSSILSKNYLIGRIAVPFGGLGSGKLDFVRWVVGELSAGKKIRIITDQTSTPTYVPDLIHNLLQLAQNNIAGTLHLAGETSLNRYEFALLCAKTFECDASLIEPVTTASLNQLAPRPKNASLETARAKSLGLKVRSLESCLIEFRDRLSGPAQT